MRVIMDRTLSSMSCYDWLCLGPVMDAPAWTGCTDWEGQADLQKVQHLMLA